MKKLDINDVLELLGEDDILDTLEYPTNNRKVAVFDDLVNAPDKIICGLETKRIHYLPIFM